jgi:hypothetical protein
MNSLQTQSGQRRTPAPRGLKEAVLASFQCNTTEASEQLHGYSPCEWEAILAWLDISGMALYLLDRLRELGIEDCVPASIRAGLRLRLERNRQRTAALLQQARRVAQKFQGAGVRFALMKGITLTPDSVPEPTLRWQTDLDFLIAESDVTAATAILRDLDYELHATSGHTMEFRSGPSGKADLENLYRADLQKSLELHCLHQYGGIPDRLTRAAIRSFGRAALPAMSPPDIMVQQALHLMKHLCGEHTRVSWVLEFWRHIRLRQYDREFWNEVRAIASVEPQADLALSMSAWLAAEMFGATPQGITEHWPADSIPEGVMAWLRRYARELLLSDSHASKLYLLLRRQLPNGIDTKAAARLMIPLCLPARITQPLPGETLTDRLNRYRIEANYSWQRLRFHLFEGMRFGIEALCWGWRLPKVQR